MANNARITDFGITQVIGNGEGQELKNRSDVVTEYLYPLKRLIVDIDYSKYGLPDGNALIGNGFGRGIASIPAGALVASAKLYVTKAGATVAKTVDFGLEKEDGTAVDADGLIDGATIAAGVKTGAGALVGTVLADKSFIVGVSGDGQATDLAGLAGKLVVEYVEG